MMRLSRLAGRVSRRTPNTSKSNGSEGGMDWVAGAIVVASTVLTMLALGGVELVRKRREARLTAKRRQGAGIWTMPRPYMGPLDWLR